MKLKFYTLFLISLFSFGKFVNGQTISCNANFTETIAGLNVSFLPTMIGDSINTIHSWNFGDGTSSNIPLTNHLYATGGSYVVKHKITKYNPNGVTMCVDSFSKTITLQTTTPCDLQAYFTFVKDSLNPKKVYFTNQTGGFLATDSIRWSFGDGTAYDYTVNPTHTYTTAGAYNVCIRVKRNTLAGTPACVSEYCKIVTIDSINPCNLQAYFTFVKDSLNPKKVYFTNQTGGFLATDSIRWSFGDGSAYNYNTNPVHTYTQAGSYNVCIRVKRNMPAGTSPCISEYCKIVTIDSINPCNLQAYFTFVKDSLNPKKVYFTNQTVGFLATDSIRWSFGDGSAYDYTVNPTHTYATAGAYNVCIRVKRNTLSGTPACVSEYCKIVNIDSITPCNLQAYFTFVKDSLNPKKVYFTNQTGGFLATDSIRWSFGDGSAYNYNTNPTHTYATAGTYNVCIRVKRNMPAGTSPCISEYCKIVTIDSINPCNLQAYFTFVKDSLNPKKVYFTNQTGGFLATDSIRWSFGDGTAYVYTVNPTHTYATAGAYNVCIRVKRNTLAGTPACVSEYCKIVNIDSITPCNLVANFTSTRDTVNRKKFYFTNTTLNFLSTDSIRWSFGDGTAYNYNVNPDHIFANYGTYNVCIRVKRNSNAATSPACVSEICKVIVVDSVANTPCNLQAYFTYQTTSGTNATTYYFQNQTQNFLATDSIRWNFGDGTAFNYTTNPVHTYAQPGTYNVCIRVKRNTPAGTAPCVSEYCKVIVIGAATCNYNVDFTTRLDSANYRKVIFTNISVQTPGAIATWNFGDGSTATSWNADHIYANGGSYNVCLRIQYNNTCVIYKCKVVQLPSTTAVCNLQPYPNPTSTVVNGTVSLTQPYIIYTRIINSYNIIVRQQQQPGTVGLNTVTVNVASLPTGIYRMVINYGNKECKGTFFKN